jgi:hypothetical protein
MYHELQQKTVHKLTLLSSSTLASLDINNGTVLVFQLAPNLSIPAFTFDPRPPPLDTESPPKEAVAPSEIGDLPVYDFAGITTSADEIENFYARQQKSGSEPYNSVLFFDLIPQNSFR